MSPNVMQPSHLPPTKLDPPAHPLSLLNRSRCNQKSKTCARQTHRIMYDSWCEVTKLPRKLFGTKSRSWRKNWSVICDLVYVCACRFEARINRSNEISPAKHCLYNDTSLPTPQSHKSKHHQSQATITHYLDILSDSFTNTTLANGDTSLTWGFTYSLSSFLRLV